MQIIPPNSAQLYDIAIFNAQIPAEGPKTLGFTVPFDGTGEPFTVNMLLTQSQQYMSQVQCMYVDNADNDSFVEFNISVSNQRIRVEGGNQAYLPIMVPKNATITIVSDGEANVPVFFMNVPFPAAVWVAN